MIKISSLLLLLLSIPLLAIFYAFVKISSPGPFIFKQKRAGKNKKPFTIYKIRTMVENAEKLKSKYQHLSETDGIAFKVRDDPRFTYFGRIIAHTGLDELPQLINVIKGDMAFVGPRPLPIAEASKIPKEYNARFSILPGLTSPWVVEGSHKLTFKKWMELDCNYVRNKNIKDDFIIILKTIKIILHSVLSTMVA